MDIVVHTPEEIERESLCRLKKPGRGCARPFCFHCQQAAEKLVKALFVHFDRRPPRMHDLLALMEEVSSDRAEGVPSPCERPTRS